MGVRYVLLLASLLLTAPHALADPLREPVCVASDLVCAGVGTCTPALCVPAACQPVARCRSDVGGYESGCAFNLTIDGRTCQIHAGLGIDELSVYAALSNGSVHMQNLPNTWVSPSVDADLRAAGFDLGSVSIGLYRSDIQDEGPRGGPYGAIAPSQNHTWTEIGFAASHRGGPHGGEDVLVVIWLLDLMPDGCFIRLPDPAVRENPCPPLHKFYS